MREDITLVLHHVRNVLREYAGACSATIPAREMNA
ncbi:class II D-tagatose-bisphosphate aldolase, non-catalytic subunit [Nocardioides panacis]|uniref:Class II D-tagatose-bisphosphate aldolase, non-catalytic subunit n=1 Tax=Nocardioides panacis TaxID=2849501 RepID=A0A975T0F3_9ACTN|nr:class II D-tagatose-bisphosphate aldolase, non-catalytic subunit [Nocardioides panacis]QWZ08604.1 class II D-tagatose-bisphosphate aldolase, non-catalytic subunit [Nocardioides panacis]